ncbi:hypothetical protein PC116_g16662 [Phytophthora cactorum]|nr:hypothetical protein PC111_g15628 [Phytophthora cactorum]KAG2812393.1 hypothetical protein PC112_g15191 [Phytophthora cactorum]KAG2850406.1 hypothetical protein PC113_g16812 [Phytophthora cactorum]KAG2888966.1 hypothetical protein PC114_g18159 [Phytophthora cactorum]KAG2899763.1 hypothetical protein PC115_g16443 [Phytophthora cactorum]
MEILQYFCDNELDSDEAATSGVDSGLEPREIVWGGKDTLNAASGGHSDIVRWLYHFNYGRDDDDTMKAAMARGDMELARWLHRVRRIPIRGEEMAAANGHLNMLQMLLRGRQIPPGVMVKPAESGHLDIIRWLVELDWSNEDVDSDDDSRHSDDFYYSGYGNSYDQERPPYLTSTGGEVTLSIHTAAINGHLMLRNIYTRMWTGLSRTRKKKTASKRTSYTLTKLSEVLGKDHQAGGISNKTMLLAVRKGLLEVVQWLCFEFSSNHMIDLFQPSWEDGRTVLAMDEAASNGHLDIVKHLHQVAPSLEVEFSRKEKPRSTLEKFEATIFGKRSTRNGIECSSSAMNEAANNHLDVVQWLHSNRTEGCTSDAMDLAAANGHLEMVQWLHAHRSESCTTNAMDGTAFGGHFEVVKWLHFAHTNAGCTTGAMNYAARMGHLDVVKWLHLNRSEGCTTEAMDGAAENGHLEIVKWLHCMRIEGCTLDAMNLPASNGHLSIVKWLHRH